MKIVVDDMPKEPKSCMFSRYNFEYDYVCMLTQGKCDLTDYGKCWCLTCVEWLKQEVVA